MTADAQAIAAALFDALGITIACGSVTLNVNESRVDSVEMKIRVKVPAKKQLDRSRGALGHLTR